MTPGSVTGKCFLNEVCSLQGTNTTFTWLGSGSRFSDSIFTPKVHLEGRNFFKFYITESTTRGFPGDSVVKNPPVNAGDVGSIPGSGRSPGEMNDNPLQYSCLGNPITEEPGGLQSMGSQKS